jgi:hypothetical protein
MHPQTGNAKSKADIIDDLLWDRDALASLRKQVENGQQSDPYALRYYDWLKHREKWEAQKAKEKEKKTKPDGNQVKEQAQQQKRIMKDDAENGQEPQRQQPSPQLREQAKQIQEAIMEQLKSTTDHSDGRQQVVVVTIPQIALDSRIFTKSDELAGKAEKQQKPRAAENEPKPGSKDNQQQALHSEPR